MRIHFIGSEGVSMRVLARMEKDRGHKVTGSDAATTGHDAKNVEGADLVVYTNAVKEDNVELIRARELGIPVVERAVLLGELSESYEKVIAVAGSHGKTTTTGMLWKIFEHLDPTVHIGGRMDGKDGQIGGHEFFLTEACEYNRSFLELHPSVAVVLNIDLDHTDCYKNISQMTGSFKEFALLAGELVIVNGDDINASTLCAGEVKVVSVGLSRDCDYFATCIENDNRGNYSFCAHTKNSRIAKIKLSVAGRHNVYNALAAIACADYYGIEGSLIAEGLHEFKGMERRFQYIGNIDGRQIFSDYAHHPKEIASSLSAAKSMTEYAEVTVIFEPHTYSRTETFLDGFVESLSIADNIILAPIYSAREKPVPGVSSHNILRKLLQKGKNAVSFDSYYEIINYLKKKPMSNEMIIFMGAGDIDKAAHIMVTGGFYSVADAAMARLTAIK